VHQSYWAMAFLLEAHDEILREVFRSVADLFNLEMDLLLLATTQVVTAPRHSRAATG